MSWSKSFASLEDFTNDRATPPEPIQGNGGNQYIAARQATEQIFMSGTVGSSGKDFSITLSGHANPDHEPAKGWANDCINIAIYQK